MNVLSLFDGISCGRVALERAGHKVANYYASEVDKYATKVSDKNYPDIHRMGDITKWRDWDVDWSSIDLILAGSPCQGFSFAGKQLAFRDERSALFFTFMDILYHVQSINPNVKFLLENTPMKQKFLDVITGLIGVEPVVINSRLVSAQNRKRYYWANWSISQPKDKQIFLKDIVLDDCLPVALHNLYGGFNEKAVRVFDQKSPTLRTSAGGGHIPSFVKKDLLHSEKAIEYMNRRVSDGRNHWDFKHHSDIRNNKSSTVVANFFKGIPYNVFKDWDCIRKFHPVECELLQTLPINYTEGVSPTQRYKGIGNGWTVDVIAHILKSMPRKET